MKDKINYKRYRIMSGYIPHKLFKMEIKKYLKRAEEEEEEKKEEVENVFDINKIKWKHLDNGE
jgi:hypothetical protein